MKFRMLRYVKVCIKVLFVFENWWTFFLVCLNLYKFNQVKYTLRNKIEFYTKPARIEGLTLVEIWGYEIYTPPFLHLRPQDVVVDIGAHMGFFSIFASKKARSGKVFAFEPSPTNFKYLEKNIKINNCKNIFPIKKGIAQKKGNRNFYFNSAFFTTSVSMFKELLEKSGIKAETFRAKVISLEDIFSECKIKKIDFLKLDCEYAEYEILLSARSSVLQRIRQISMEYHQDFYKANLLVAFLKKNGFIIHQVPANDVIGMLYAKRS